MPKMTYKETRLYPVILHHDGDLWGYFSPEFGGGGAPTQAEALRLAQLMLDDEIATLVDAGQDLPAPMDANDIEADGGVVAWLPVTVTNAAERIYITIPKSLLARVDAVTPNRSAFFAELAKDRLQVAHQND
jgi:hypothetical protein